jgi:hypothetical protein
VGENFHWHFGAQLDWGPDGLLYFAQGDKMIDEAWSSDVTHFAGEDKRLICGNDASQRAPHSAHLGRAAYDWASLIHPPFARVCRPQAALFACTRMEASH